MIKTAKNRILSAAIFLALRKIIGIMWFSDKTSNLGVGVWGFLVSSLDLVFLCFFGIW